MTLTHEYDYLGRRIEMKSHYDTGNPGAVIRKRYIWDGWNVLADLWADYGNAVASTFVWGPDVTGTFSGAGGIGGLVIVYYNGRAFLPLQDGRGNIYGYLDTYTRKNAAAWDFSTYGMTLYERGYTAGVSSSWDFPFRYQSKMQDTAGHLLYFGMRYYHPGMGRFINRDPIGENGGLNVHAYCGNDPIDGSDVLGLILADENYSHTESEDAGEEWIIYQVWVDDAGEKMRKEVRREKKGTAMDPVEVRPIDVEITIVRDNSSDYGGFGGGQSFYGAESPAGEGDESAEKPGPSKEECDALRQRYPRLFERPSDGYKDKEEAIVAASIAAAVKTGMLGEYTSVIYGRQRAGRFDYTTPTPAVGGTAGGYVQINNPHGTKLEALTHGHNTGWEAWAFANMDANGEVPDKKEYFELNEFFSASDIAASIRTGVPIYVFTFSGDIKMYDGPNRGPYKGNHPGVRVKSAPPKAEAVKIVECLRAKM